MATYQSRIPNDILRPSRASHYEMKELVKTPTKLKSLIHAKPKNSTTTSKKTTSQPIFYSSIFEKTFNARLVYFKRLSAFLSLILAFVLTLLSKKSSFFMIPIKLPFLFGSCIFIQSLRELTMTVDFNPSYKSFSNQVVGEVFSKKFVNILLGYLIASFCYFLVVYSQIADKNFKYYVTSPTKTISPFVNDEFVFFWYHCLFVAVYYSLQHAVFLRSKLNFKFGVSSVNPKNSLFKNQSQFFKMSAMSVIFTAIFSFISYRILRSIIYKVFLYPFYWPLNLNPKIPLAKLSTSMVFHLIILDGILFYVWELLNHIFNCYATVGCLREGKSLSTLSKDPVNSLLSGLRDAKRPLVRLTAFQELAYIAMSEDPKLRAFLYSSHFADTYLWTKILRECSELIEDASKRVRAKPKILKNSLTNEPKHITKPSIFGNSKSTTKETKDHTISHYSLKPEELVSPKKPTNRKHHVISMMNEEMEPINLQKILMPMVKFVKNQYAKFMNSNVGTPFRSTMKMEANSRVINPVNVGNAILSISHMLLSAEFEDKKNVVISTLPEVLAILEKFITAASIFIKNPPVEDHSNQKNSIILLHDLAMRFFFEIVVKYNHMLNEFALSQPVFDLSKQCIDLAIEQQKELDFENGW